jgi:hypothetical protein
MTEKEFFELYQERLSNIISEYKQSILDSSDIGHIHLRNKTSDLTAQITYKANLLISELLVENNFHPDSPTPAAARLHRVANLKRDMQLPQFTSKIPAFLSRCFLDLNATFKIN